MSRLRYPLKDLLGDPTSEEALARVWRGIDARAPRGRSRTRVWAMASVAAAAGVAIAFATFERRDRGPLRFADGRPLGAVEARRTYRSRPVFSPAIGRREPSPA